MKRDYGPYLNSGRLMAVPVRRVTLWDRLLDVAAGIGLVFAMGIVLVGMGVVL